VSRDLLLSLDLGTTRVRALLVDAEGRVRGRAERALRTAYPAPGWVEQDPDEMWQQSLVVLRDALHDAQATPLAVAGLGVVTQRSTALAWSRTSGRPLAPAIGWQDQRTVPREAEYLASGLLVSSLASALKFEWWMRREGDVMRAARAGDLRLGTPDVWLTDRLTGGAAHVTDPSEAASTGLLDLAAGDWSRDALELFEIPREALPDIVATSGCIGETPSALLGAPIPVAARAGDQQAACFAQGVHTSGAAKLTLGTSGMLDVHIGTSLRQPPLGSYPLSLWRLGDAADCYCLEGTLITAGAAIDWLAAVGILTDATDLDRVAAEVPDSGGAIFVPALQGLGTPYMQNRARGLLAGLTRGTNRAHIARAAIDGIAHRCADLCDTLVSGDAPLRVDGGLARSDRIVQRLADLAGRPLLRAAETETTALGGAQLAGLATGVFASLDACRATLAPPTRFEPRASPEQRAGERERWAKALAKAL
jgi:glycerol kinase